MEGKKDKEMKQGKKKGCREGMTLKERCTVKKERHAVKDRINYIIKERNRKEDRKDGWKEGCRD